jgi:branched-chain amino acid transport system substrate-binding protein
LIFARTQGRTLLKRLGILALATLLVASCFSLSRALAAGEPYSIGAVLSESGPGSSLGRPEADSVQLAVDEINKAGGVSGHPLKVTIVDDESNPTTAVNAVRSLLDQKVIAIVGPSLTQTSLAVSPIVADAGVPMISLGSSAQIIEPAADHKWIFKVPITDIHMARLIQGALKKQNQLKVAVIYRDDDYGKTGLTHFEDAGKSVGIDVIDSEAIASTASDATTQLTHIKAANPQAVVVWTTLPSAATVIKSYRELSVPYPLYYSDGAATGVFLAQAGDALNGAYIASLKINVADQLPPGDPQARLLRHYIDAFDQLYPKDAPVSIFGGFGYDSIYLLKTALQSAGTAQADKLRDALEHTTYLGASGMFRISPSDHNGLAQDSTVLTKIDGGKFTIAH